VALAKTFGCEAVVLTKPYGQTFPLDEVKALLTPDVKAVFVQATETSPVCAMTWPDSPAW